MKKIVCFFFSMIFCASFVMAQNNDLSKPLNPDPKVKIGKLDNGLTYYIRHNETPKNHVELRLAVNAGSNQENENQRGLAHFCEHMAFNGIEGFPKNTMVSTLQSLGVVFGADLNAYTSFDETVYMIPMPLNNPSNLETGLKMLKGWASGVLFDNKEIDAERGVITEEYRLGLGADDRMRKVYWPVLMNGSRYAERMPIGLLDVIQNFDYQVIKDFYHDWYRPDLEAIVVVGDVDVDVVEKKIKDLFGTIQPRTNPRVKEHYPIAKTKEPMVAIATDKEAGGNQVMMVRKMPHFVIKTIGDFRKQLVIDLFNSMYESRYEEMAQDPKCPFIGGAAGYFNFVGETDMYGAQAVSKDNRIIETLESLMREDYRVLKHGFLQTELDRAKDALLEDYERAANEADKTESSHLVNEYVSNFLHNDPIPGAKRENTYAKKYMESITLEEVNALAKEWITEDNITVIITAPEKEGVTVPTKEQVLNVINNKTLANVDPYVDNYKDQEILDKSTLTPGKIVKTEKIESIDATHLTLSNGIQVYLKKTNFKNDEILFSAFSFGGKSLYPVSDLASADFAADIIDRGGIGELDYNTLMTKMKSKKAGVSPSISAISENFSGSTSPKDIEFFFQYLHAFFTNPRVDENAMELVMNETKEMMKMLNANAMYHFFGKFIGAAMPDPYMSNQLTYTDEYLEKVSFERAVQIYKERFANPADFTFIFVGNYDENVMNDMINLYLGSLKTTPVREQFKDVFVKPQDGIVNVNEYFGTENQSWLGLAFRTPFEYNDKNNMIVTEIGDALDIEFIEVVREKMGNVYSPMCQVGASKYPSPEMTTMIMLGCASENVEKLNDACFKILKNFAAKGPSKKTLAKVKQQLISTREKNIQTNNFWLSYISSKLVNQGDFNAVNEYADLVNSITTKDMVNFMKKYFNFDNYTRVNLYPTTMK